MSGHIRMMTLGLVLFAASNVAAMDAERGKSNQYDAVAGGVGINARARLVNEAAPDHNVKMVFSLDAGNYLADVHVKVSDLSGRPVVEGTAKGPCLRKTSGVYTRRRPPTGTRP